MRTARSRFVNALSFRRWRLGAGVWALAFGRWRLGAGDLKLARIKPELRERQTHMTDTQVEMDSARLELPHQSRRKTHEALVFLPIRSTSSNGDDAWGEANITTRARISERSRRRTKRRGPKAAGATFTANAAPLTRAAPRKLPRARYLARTLLGPAPPSDAAHRARCPSRLESGMVSRCSLLNPSEPHPPDRRSREPRLADIGHAWIGDPAGSARQSHAPPLRPILGRPLARLAASHSDPSPQRPRLRATKSPQTRRERARPPGSAVFRTMVRRLHSRPSARLSQRGPTMHRARANLATPSRLEAARAHRSERTSTRRGARTSARRCRGSS